MYSSGKKSVIFCFALLLPQILVDFQNQGQIWNLLVLTFSKHPLHVQFDQVLPEIFEVKDTWCHSFIFMIIDFTERKTIEIWRFLHPRPFDGISKDYCQTRVQTISRSTLDASQVLSNSISISDSGGLDLSRLCNCKYTTTHPPTTQTTCWSLPEHSGTS